jgi:hypothetical protein
MVRELILIKKDTGKSAAGLLEKARLFLFLPSTVPYANIISSTPDHTAICCRTTGSSNLQGSRARKRWKKQDPWCH